MINRVSISLAAIAAMGIAGAASAQEDVDVQINVLEVVEILLPNGNLIQLNAGGVAAGGGENTAGLDFDVVSNVDHTITVTADNVGGITGNPTGDHNSWVLAQGVDTTNAAQQLAFRPWVCVGGGLSGGGCERWWNDGTVDAVEFNEVAGNATHTLNVAAGDHLNADGSGIAAPGQYDAILTIEIASN